MVELLVGHSADVNRAQSFGDGATPLGEVARFGETSMTVAALLRARADPNLPNPKNGETPLFVALTRGHRETAAIMVKAGANLSKMKREDVEKAWKKAIEHEAYDSVVESLIRTLGMDTELDGDERTCRVVLSGAKLERFRKLAETYGRFLGRYKLASVIKHSSGTCIVIFAEDLRDNVHGGGDPPVERVFGSFEYMSPECWKREYGTPSAASDIFSLGLVMWEMLARRRISDFLLDENNPDHTCVDKNGKTVRDVAVVPVLLVKGERPRFTGLLPEVREQCGWHVYYRLMQACWVAEIGKRPTAARVAEALRLAKSYVRSEQTEQEIAALEAEASPEEVATLEAEASPGNGEAAVGYDDFLVMVGVQDKKEELAEYLTEGGELDQLKQMDDEELDEDILDDLGLDEETKTSFHEALRTLQQLPATDEQPTDDKEVSEFDPAVVAAEREAQWPKWPALQKMLPGLRGLDEAETQTLEEARLQAKNEEFAATVAAKDGELAAKDGELAAKDEELAATVAAKDEELAAKDGELELLRAQLARLEGVPPQRRTADPQ